MDGASNIYKMIAMHAAIQYIEYKYTAGKGLKKRWQT
jgi:hypothetical protein